MLMLSTHSQRIQNMLFFLGLEYVTQYSMNLYSISFLMTQQLMDEVGSEQPLYIPWKFIFSWQQRAWMA
jgi:hypothetical protein